MMFVTPRAGIIGSKKTRGAITIVEIADVSNTGQDIVVRIVRIGPETMANGDFPATGE